MILLVHTGINGIVAADPGSGVLAAHDDFDLIDRLLDGLVDTFRILGHGKGAQGKAIADIFFI